MDEKKFRELYVKAIDIIEAEYSDDDPDAELADDDQKVIWLDDKLIAVNGILNKMFKLIEEVT